MSNPNWTRDELILALDLYFREPSARGSKKHPAVNELSKVLNQLPIHSFKAYGNLFRNPNGIGMKLSNFLRYDPAYHGKGLERGSHLEEAIWNEFAHDHERLRRTADAIYENYEFISEYPPTIVEVVDEEEAIEGSILTRVHKSRERSAAIVKRKKDKILKETGTLACEVCGFSFQEFYGDIGEGFAECHHEVPLSELSPGSRTKLTDLRILCANCHRMIHRSKPWLSVDTLRQMIKTID